MLSGASPTCQTIGHQLVPQLPKGRRVSWPGSQVTNTPIKINCGKWEVVAGWSQKKWQSLWTGATTGANDQIERMKDGLTQHSKDIHAQKRAAKQWTRGCPTESARFGPAFHTEIHTTASTAGELSPTTNKAGHLKNRETKRRGRSASWSLADS